MPKKARGLSRDPMGGARTAEARGATRVQISREEAGALVALCATLYEMCGIALGPEKHEMIRARLRSRLEDLGLPHLRAYLDFLGQSAAERVEFVNRLTTNKTDFFREPEHFKMLVRQVLASWDNRQCLYVWCAASSTGEEAYTLAMVLAEHQKSHPGFEFRILASDIDTSVLARANAGLYEEDLLTPVPPGLKSSYFERVSNKGGHWRIKDPIRNRLKFRRFNLCRDCGELGNFRFHVVFLRNVLIYFDDHSTRQALSTVLSHMHPGALLFIGHSESLRSFEREVECAGNSLYRKRA